MCATPASAFDERGIQFWMERVVKEIENVGSDFAADPVHDLRVALRRCRAIAEGIRTIDPDPRWRKMRRAAKALFSSLGELRDTQVLEEWLQRLRPAEGPAKARLLSYFTQREAEQKTVAAAAIAAFDTQQWLRWSRALEKRLRDDPIEPEVFQVVALEKLEAAQELQSIASRTRSKTALHSVRIGLKRFRYVVENFLPEQHERWRDDLKELQDVLGEIHDLDVLWTTALHIHAYTSSQEKEQWHSGIAHARAERIAIYKQKLAGRHSLLRQWREQLPVADPLRHAIQRKFQIWSGFLDPDPAHTKRVLQTSLDFFDRVHSFDLIRAATFEDIPTRDLVTIATITHQVGGVSGKKTRRKRTARLLEKLDVPPGWTPEHLRLIGLIARCHRGKLPFDDPAFRRMSRIKRDLIAVLGGILRLSEALDASRPAEDHGARLERNEGYLVLRAEGYAQPEQLAAASHLLQTACHVPIMVLTDPIPAHPQRARSRTRPQAASSSVSSDSPSLVRLTRFPEFT